MTQSLDAAIRAIVAEEVAAAIRILREEMAVQADQTLTFTEACDYLNLSEHTLRKYIRQKRIPHRVVGADGSRKPRYLFSTLSLDKWKAAQEAANYMEGR
ncbi:helix-turn-helix domain-containing protein [Paenibacillus koleovorans]|uniref:helix-turn-helix domain-containing protein n=1 Tax=Paenibacillus koleovorans TaxID=121608 RepID=UPI000FD7B081|nr:helix-turn-helix domain-containing protein [Paenibacillus koleovorans]